jgi:hypothetical protein
LKKARQVIALTDSGAAFYSTAPAGSPDNVNKQKAHAASLRHLHVSHYWGGAVSGTSQQHMLPLSSWADIRLKA